MAGMLVEYQDGDVTCEGYVAMPEGTGPFPTVMIVHQWAGIGPQERETADRLAVEKGYIGFAVDVYGKGVRGDPAGDNGHLLGPWFGDRAALLRRLMAAVDFVRNHPHTNNNKIGAMGYCFGGLCVLDIARGNAEVKGVVSLHGIFAPPNIGPQGKIWSKILVCHGWDDPMADPQSVLGLAKELTDAEANWQIHAYGHTSHAFTRKSANKPEAGMNYSADADRRSWQASMDFFGEIF